MASFRIPLRGERREMGVRMALGTTPARLRVGLLRQGLLTIVAGAIPGIAGRRARRTAPSDTWWMARKRANAATYAASVLFIASIAAVGIWVATRPVARLNIVEILRTE